MFSKWYSVVIKCLLGIKWYSMKKKIIEYPKDRGIRREEGRTSAMKQ
jgi:hypothetical protein